MTKKTQSNIYSTPEEFPIPEGVDPVSTLLFTLDRAEGILSLLIDNSSSGSTQQAAWAVQGMIRQCQALVDYWNDTQNTQE